MGCGLFVRLKKIFFIFIASVFFTSGANASVNARGAAPADAEYDKLAVADAVKFAIERSTELKNLDENAYLNELNRDTLRNSVIQTVTEAQFINAQVQIMQNELRQAMFNENIALQKLSIEYTITRYFIAIISAERDLRLYDANLELSERQLTISKVRAELGLMSQIAYDTQKSNYEKDVSAREIRTIGIANAYRTLNNAMGKETNKRYALVLEYAFEPLPETNLTRYINESINGNVAIKNRENELAALEYRLQLTSDRDVSDELTININQVKRALSDAKSNVEDKITSCYNDIRSMETQYALNMKELDDMRGQLMIKEVQLELGRLTQIDADTYKYQISAMENRVLNQIDDHYVKKIQFYNPDFL